MEPLFSRFGRSATTPRSTAMRAARRSSRALGLSPISRVSKVAGYAATQSYVDSVGVPPHRPRNLHAGSTTKDYAAASFSPSRRRLT